MKLALHLNAQRVDARRRMQLLFAVRDAMGAASGGELPRSYFDAAAENEEEADYFQFLAKSRRPPKEDH